MMAGDPPVMDYDSHRHSPTATEADDVMQQQSIASPDFEFAFDAVEEAHSEHPAGEPTTEWHPANDLPTFPMEESQPMHQHTTGSATRDEGAPIEASAVAPPTDATEAAGLQLHPPHSHVGHGPSVSHPAAYPEVAASAQLPLPREVQLLGQPLLVQHSNGCSRSRPWDGVRACYRLDVTEYFEEAIRLGLYPTLEQQPPQQQQQSQPQVITKPVRRPAIMQGIVLAPDGSDGGVGLALAEKQATLHPVLQPQRKRGRPSLRDVAPSVASEMLSLDDALKVPPPPGVRPWNWRRQQQRAVQRAEAVKDPAAAKVRRPRQQRKQAATAGKGGSSTGAVAEALLLAAQSEGINHGRMHMNAQLQLSDVRPSAPQFHAPTRKRTRAKESGPSSEAAAASETALDIEVDAAMDAEDSGLTETSVGAPAMECLNGGQEASSAPAADLTSSAPAGRSAVTAAATTAEVRNAVGEAKPSAPMPITAAAAEAATADTGPSSLLPAVTATQAPATHTLPDLSTSAVDTRPDLSTSLPAVSVVDASGTGAPGANEQQDPSSSVPACRGEGSAHGWADLMQLPVSRWPSAFATASTAAGGEHGSRSSIDADADPATALLGLQTETGPLVEVSSGADDASGMILPD